MWGTNNLHEILTDFPEALLGSSTPVCHRNCKRACREPISPQNQNLSVECENICRLWCFHLLCPCELCSCSSGRTQLPQARRRHYINFNREQNTSLHTADSISCYFYSLGPFHIPVWRCSLPEAHPASAACLWIQKGPNNLHVSPSPSGSNSHSQTPPPPEDVHTDSCILQSNTNKRFWQLVT